jgi:hypothetical protein
MPEQQGVFYFTHQTALLTLLARMNVANDQNPPTHSNYGSQSKRMWKTSSISPFNGNLMAVFFNCSSGSGATEQKIVFYLQESVLPLQGCEAGICSWETIRDKYMSFADDCNVNRTCAGLDSGVGQMHMSIAALVVAAVVYFKLV